MGDVDKVCGKTLPRFLYCGAIFEAKVPSESPFYDERTEGGRTRLKSGSTISAMNISSCHEKLSDVPKNELMYANAATKDRDPRFRIGFLRGTEFMTFKKTAELNTQGMSLNNDPKLYPTGYDFVEMVDMSGTMVNGGGVSKKEEAVAKVRINLNQTCTTPTPRVPTPAPLPAPSPSAAKDDDDPPKLKTEYIVAIAGGVILLIILGAVLYSRKNNNDNEDEDDAD
jgi:hypothetical protein